MESEQIINKNINLNETNKKSRKSLVCGMNCCCNTKNNTAGTAEIYACGDMMDVSLSAQETKLSLVVW